MAAAEGVAIALAGMIAGRAGLGTLVGAESSWWTAGIADEGPWRWLGVAKMVAVVGKVVGRVAGGLVRGSARGRCRPTF